MIKINEWHDFQVSVTLLRISQTKADAQVKSELFRTYHWGLASQTFVDVNSRIKIENCANEKTLFRLSASERISNSDIYIDIDVKISTLNNLIKVITKIKKKRKNLELNIEEVLNHNTSITFH